MSETNIAVNPLQTWFSLASDHGIYDKTAYATFSNELCRIKKQYARRDYNCRRISTRSQEMTLEDISVICSRSKYSCIWCKIPVFPMRETIAISIHHATFDRIYDCNPHTRDNCVLSCIKCNSKRNSEKIRNDNSIRLQQARKKMQ